MGLSLRTIMPVVAATGLIAASATSAVAAPAPGHGHATPPPAVRTHGMIKASGVTLPRTVLPRLALRSTSQSPEWSGYAVAADSGKHVKSITSNFTIPSLNCANSPDGSVMEHWAGLDGLNDNTSEQVGVVASCNGGTPSYAAFYDMVPEPGVAFDGVNPGDAVKVSVTFTGSGYNLVLTDITTGGVVVNTTQSCPPGSTCGNRSAEVITEDPGGGVAGGFDLADFGMVNDTGAAVTAVGGNHGSLAALAGFWTSAKITMVDPANSPMAVPSALFGGKAFNTTWRAAT
jgi:peptidase A4-like protein